MKNIMILAACCSILLTACSEQDETNPAGDFVFVKGGTFQLGATEKEKMFLILEPDWMKQYAPKTVTVGDFYISKYEVTQRQWKEVMPAERYPVTWTDDDAPAFDISWEQAVKFCNALNEREGYDGWYKKVTRGYGYNYRMKEDGNGYRLPTNYEWEYAARGGAKSRGYAFSGSDDLFEVAHFGVEVPCRVGMYKPNELGIYDMTGNVDEYTYNVDDEKRVGGMQGGGFKPSLTPYQLVIYYRGLSSDDTQGLRLVLDGEKPANAKRGYMSKDRRAFRLRGKVKQCKEFLEVEFDEKGRLVRNNETCVEYAEGTDTKGTIYFGRGAGRYKVGKFTPGRNNYLLVRDREGRIIQMSGDMEAWEYKYDEDGFIISERSGMSSFSVTEKYLSSDENGHPLTSKMEGGDESIYFEYSITYSNYKLDKAGNWIERTAHKKGYDLESDEDFNYDPSTRKEVDETKVQKQSIEYYD